MTVRLSMAARARLGGYARARRLSRTRRREIARMGGEAVNARKSVVQRRALARKAIAARWRKVRARAKERT